MQTLPTELYLSPAVTGHLDRCQHRGHLPEQKQTRRELSCSVYVHIRTTITGQSATVA